jgi:hypothetical protein
MNFTKALAGLTLGVLSTGASPAFAARFEVSYTTTFTTVTSTVDCGDCGQTPTRTQSPLDPISMTSTVFLDIQDRHIEPTHIVTFPFMISGGQLMGFEPNSNAPWASLVPASLLGDADVAEPASGLGILGITRSRTSFGDPNDPATRETDTWGFYRHLGWTAQDGADMLATSSMFQTTPFPVTFENLGASLTASQFASRMLQDFWCTGCTSTTEARLASSLNGISRTTSYGGTVTAFSIRDLDAVAAVPEPSTYALMLVGVAAIGFAARRRRAAGTINP